MPVFTVVKPGPPHVEAERRRVQMSINRISSITVIAVRGEIDAASWREVAAAVSARLCECRQLLVDLSEVKFLAIQGYSALHTIKIACGQRPIPWLLVPSPEVSRVLRICDPNGTLPLAATAAAGLAVLDRVPPRHLRLL